MSEIRTERDDGASLHVFSQKEWQTGIFFKHCLRGEVENVGESERMEIAEERSQREGGGL